MESPETSKSFSLEVIVYMAGIPLQIERQWRIELQEKVGIILANDAIVTELDRHFLVA